MEGGKGGHCSGELHAHSRPFVPHTPRFSPALDLDRHDVRLDAALVDALEDLEVAAVAPVRVPRVVDDPVALEGRERERKVGSVRRGEALLVAQIQTPGRPRCPSRGS